MTETSKFELCNVNVLESLEQLKDLILYLASVSGEIW